MVRVRLVVVMVGLTGTACLCGSPWYDDYYLCEDLASRSDCDRNECVVAVCADYGACGTMGVAYARVEMKVLADAEEECEHRRAEWYERWASECPDTGDEASAVEGTDSASAWDSVADPEPDFPPWDVEVSCEEWSE
jgi:hypothetical protein